jgi:sulfopyruvate decarboxylase subunit alpha
MRKCISEKGPAEASTVVAGDSVGLGLGAEAAGGPQPADKSATAVTSSPETTFGTSLQLGMGVSGYGLQSVSSLGRGDDVPVSVANSQVVYDAMKGVGVRLVSALPETWLVHLIRIADEDPEMTLVRLAKEEEGVGVSAGAHFAGVKSAMLMQNHGFLQAINGIVGVSLLYKIPLLMLITDRGTFGEKDPWQTEGGKHTRPVLDALHIAHDDLSRPQDVEPKMAQAMALAQSSLSPVALLLQRDLMWEEPK